LVKLEVPAVALKILLVVLIPGLTFSYDHLLVSIAPLLQFVVRGEPTEALVGN
jgi:hypothetical protein